ncbi:MAG: AzlC family ABC transporter permease, partial [Nocardioidaceae bacterium]|nr:AzlC family ABC transporter permease [Nocardioidaceae bacterium]
MPRLASTQERRELLADSLGVGVATGAYGVSFGAIATTSGFSVLQACALSLLVFTGASQFALVGVVAAGGTPASAAATTL